ncbi:RNA recognition motif protein [Rhizoctonia solani 123E]|uniref:18S rRNA factor 2 n=1 Tax=Rhizoctonia solani 123E TaxID=1423351 RepID=A0A074S7N5_9AGAM|nr:RNA recognition motif protein [Rhizoctonia solani 123E]
MGRKEKQALLNQAEDAVEHADYVEGSSKDYGGSGSESGDEPQEATELSGEEDSEEYASEGEGDQGLKTVQPLSGEALAKFEKAQQKAGIIYISRIPPGMRPAKVKHLMSNYGKVGRVFLQQEDPKRAYLRKKHTATKKVHYTEGWVEFESKHVARSVAEMLNAQPIGGKKGTRWRDDIWTMKYLPKFKWNMLTEQVAQEAAAHTARLRVELSQSKAEQRDYLRNVELARVLEKRAQRKRKSESNEAETTRTTSKVIEDHVPPKIKKARIQGANPDVRRTSGETLNNVLSSVRGPERVVSHSPQPPRMSSWPPPGYVPPGSAPGSRSPTDANVPMKYPPGPDYYPNDGWGSRDREFERDRDGWGRDRDLHEYERRRPDWENRRAQGRTRSRSPSGEDGRLKRRRSVSPSNDRDRYDPRPRFDEHGTSPGRGRGPLDPYSVDIPVSFRAFCEWYRYHNPEAAQEEEKVKREASEAGKELDKAADPMRAHFDAYKRKMLLKQNNMLFNAHKSQVWFIERYDPATEHVTLRDRIKAEGRKGRTARFVQELEEGKYDPVMEDPTTATTEDKPEGSPRAEGRAESTNELDFDIENDDEGNSKPTAEVTENGKAKEGPQGGRDVECSMETEGNQVMIRTLPPDIGRVKLEQALNTIPGFVYVTFGEPTFKKNFYRAAWIRFADDADMDQVMNSLSELKIDNFKLHTTRIVRPFTGRARITPSAACHPQRLTKDLARAKQLAHIYEEESRVLNRVQDVSETANGETDDESSLGSGCEHVERRFEKLVAELEEKEGGSDGPNFAAKSLGVQLDLYLAYLRTAFNCCYYCAARADFPEELQRRCLKHTRPNVIVPASDPLSDERWLEWLDHKIAVLAEPDKVDPAEYGAKNYDDELSRCVEEHIKQEEEGKFRCKTCTKLFKATSFVEKHIANKHPELTQELDTIPFFNNFALDPHHIQIPKLPPGPDPRAPPLPRMTYPMGDPRHMYPMGGPPPYGYRPPSPPGYRGYPPPFDPYYAGYGPPQAYGRPRSPMRGGGPRLSDRVGEYAPPDPMLAGLPPRPVPAQGLDMPAGPPGRPLPPPDAREDPRASAGRKSYHDMDGVAEGDVELMY